MKVLAGIITFLLFLGIVGGGLYYGYNRYLSPVQGVEEFVSVIIPKGATAREVAEKLVDEGMIRNDWVFRAYVKLNQKEGELRAGQFRLSKSWSLPEIVDYLGKGGFEGVWVTVVEGWRRSQVGLAFDKALKPCESIRQVQDEPSQGLSSECFSLEQFLDLTEDGEGYLFPETYLVPYTANAETVVKLLVDTFNEKTSTIINDNANPPEPLNHESAIILASLLEREAAKAEDFPIVAGILLKRLRNDWPLQVDATLQYIKATNKCAKPLFNATGGIYPVCDDWWPTPYAEDKELDSPYNTYKNIGLPPAPIASPGLQTITAVFNPTETDYWYYITDSNGQMHYAKDLSEHNANVERYLR